MAVFRKAPILALLITAGVAACARAPTSAPVFMQELGPVPATPANMAQLQRNDDYKISALNSTVKGLQSKVQHEDAALATAKKDAAAQRIKDEKQRAAAVGAAKDAQSQADAADAEAHDATVRADAAAALATQKATDAAALAKLQAKVDSDRAKQQQLDSQVARMKQQLLNQAATIKNEADQLKREDARAREVAAVAGSSLLLLLLGAAMYVIVRAKNKKAKAGLKNEETVCQEPILPTPHGAIATEISNPLAQSDKKEFEEFQRKAINSYFERNPTMSGVATPQTDDQSESCSLLDASGAVLGMVYPSKIVSNLALPDESFVQLCVNHSGSILELGSASPEYAAEFKRIAGELSSKGQLLDASGKPVEYSLIVIDGEALPPLAPDAASTSDNTSAPPLVFTTTGKLLSANENDLEQTTLSAEQSPILSTKYLQSFFGSTYTVLTGKATDGRDLVSVLDPTGQITAQAGPGYLDLVKPDPMGVLLAFKTLGNNLKTAPDSTIAFVKEFYSFALLLANNNVLEAPNGSKISSDQLAVNGEYVKNSPILHPTSAPAAKPTTAKSLDGTYPMLREVLGPCGRYIEKPTPTGVETDASASKQNRLAIAPFEFSKIDQNVRVSFNGSLAPTTEQVRATAKAIFDLKAVGFNVNIAVSNKSPEVLSQLLTAYGLVMDENGYSARRPDRRPAASPPVEACVV